MCRGLLLSPFAIAGFGHPSVRFRNKVQGKDMSIQWDSDSEIKGESGNGSN